MKVLQLVIIMTVSTGGAAACSHQKTSTSAPTPSMAVVSSKTAFVVTTSDALSSETAQVGTTFTATLAEPLRSDDGRVVAVPGTWLRGHVVAVQSGDEPRLAISFDSIGTVGGPALFDVSVVRAFNGPFTVATTRRTREVDADLVVRSSDLAVGGGPAAEGKEPVGTAAVLPKGSRFELALATPLSVAMPK